MELQQSGWNCMNFTFSLHWNFLRLRAKCASTSAPESLGTTHRGLGTTGIAAAVGKLSLTMYILSRMVSDCRTIPMSCFQPHWQGYVALRTLLLSEILWSLAHRWHGNNHFSSPVHDLPSFAFAQRDQIVERWTWQNRSAELWNSTSLGA
jgi:hypothetical protein